MSHRPSSKGLFLAVNISLRPSAELDVFLRGMHAVLPMFTGAPEPDENQPFGWTLVLSGQKHSWHDGGALPEFFNLWKLPEPLEPSIWDAMRAAAADRDYIRLDEVVDSEVQELMHTNDIYTPTSLSPDEPGTIYMRERLHMICNPTEFENRMPVVAYEAKQACDAKLVLGLSNVTGRLRTFTNIWRLPAANHEQLRGFLEKQKVYKQAVVSHSADTMTQINYHARSSGIQLTGPHRVAPRVVSG